MKFEYYTRRRLKKYGASENTNLQKTRLKTEVNENVESQLELASHICK